MNYLLDPKNITNFNSSRLDLELLILFWVCAAGKKADVASKNLNNVLVHGSKLFKKESPFEIILEFGHNLSEELKNNGIGCYNNKSKTMIFLASSNIDLFNCSVFDLEKVPGIGPKTSRCFLIHSRKHTRHAGLDTHCLKYLRDKGYNVPKSTPSGRKYLEIENIFLDLADKSGKTLAEFDLEIWKKYSGAV